MRVHLLTLPVLVLVTFSAAPAGDDTGKKELVGMAGEWRLVGGEESGEAAPDFVIKNLVCVIAGDRLTFRGVATLEDKASKLRIKIDPSTMPKCIDLKVEAGSLKGDVLEGVYERKGDELKLCIYMGKGNRPLEFETKPGSNRVLFLLKREKP